MNSRHTDDDRGGHVTEPVYDSSMSEHVTAGAADASICELSLVAWKVIAVNRFGIAVMEASRRF